METEIAARYTPGQIEQSWYDRWIEEGCFQPSESAPNSPYTIVIPPPNVTGALHMGHALNNTLQDIVLRKKRMQGHPTLWMPGTDHAGIATQTVVEKMLLKDGIRKEELGREEFIGHIWKWKEEYGGRILGQLKKLGNSCDWSRTRFTMDDGLSLAVRNAFTRLFDKGLIYRGERLINWDPGSKTALSDDEIEHKEVSTHLWYLKYPVVGEAGRFVTVATTRPETMLGDTGVAVHPDDPRYGSLVGKNVLLPILDREIPIVADETVDPKFGTGAVKLTPAHDPADYERGRRHNLPLINVMNQDGSLNENAGKYQGFDRFDARKAIVDELSESGLLEKIEDHVHNVGHSYRSNAIIEPLISEQWFVRMKPLAEVAIQASKEGKLRFLPDRWEKVYLHWLENVKDWCISRQIWWGHRIPVYYDAEGNAAASVEPIDVHPKTGNPIVRQDEDVLDTWFSSALWPFSTLGWPENTPDLEKFFPTQTLVTDRGIIYLWVGRMVMTSLEFLEKLPFDTVYITATVLDEHGQRMSKSLGNGIDPIDMIEQYGADAVRFTLPLLTSEGQDIKLSPTKFEMGRNFMNKLWNACRFSLTNIEGFDAKPSGASPALEDRWILSRLTRVVTAETDALDRFKFYDSAQEIYHFLWDEFCDWYLEIIKPRIYEEVEGGESRAHARMTLITVLDTVLRLLHPFAPFISEEIWEKLRPFLKVAHGKEPEAMLCTGSWPVADSTVSDEGVETEFAQVMDIVRSVRNIRAEYNVPKNQKIEALVSVPAAGGEVSLDAQNAVRFLCKVENLRVEVDGKRPDKCAAAVVGEIQVFVPLLGIIDVEKESKRLADKIEKAKKFLTGISKKLENKAYIEKAPPELVSRDREKMAEIRSEIEKLEVNLKEL